MTLQEIIDSAYLPAIELIGVKDTPEARVMILTIGLQESRFQYRRQLGDGPARSFWQFERGGGVKGVLEHTASKSRAIALCSALAVDPDPMSVWNAMGHDDILGAGFARLLLLTDPRALPEVTNTQGAWDCYVRNWRPGKPHPQTWSDFHHQARELVA